MLGAFNACRCEEVNAQYCMCSHRCVCVSAHRSVMKLSDHADRIQTEDQYATDDHEWPAIIEEGFDDCNLYDIYLFRIFIGTGMLDSITEYVKTISPKTGRFYVSSLLSVVTSMVICNQTIAIMMTEQLGCIFV